ncbi:unnamed protein product [Rotaria sp. Silwood1]|nr:unnamed protein product [Rotaria sp. Silwood1]CAF3616531.1 unnamed protein product [Rotaria sp. Silwood1]CAF3677569.1 unnamed protein product [Rotaria sp. Silwood1]CAF4614738.1 unnamed protein product [Rotaria sp. Silwood1]CAF4722494.1 unnamed protein product [Rotaria sp. Silwood1]
MEQSRALNEALKLLTGLDNDSTKRANIVEYVKEKGTIAVFAYGSLIWNPCEHVEHIIPNCLLNGYTKGFICQDFIYRGTKDFKGLTMGLKPCEKSFVKGYLLMASANKLIPFIEAFIKRETPISVDGTKMDIYTYDFLPVIMPGGKTIEWALTCVANSNSQFYLPMTLSIKQQAEIMSRACGINGTNFQYLHNTLHTYRHLSLIDTFTVDMEELYATVLIYRQYLTKYERQWLESFEKLTTRDERELAIKLQRTNNVRMRKQNLFARICSIEPVVFPKYNRMVSV